MAPPPTPSWQTAQHYPSHLAGSPASSRYPQPPARTGQGLFACSVAQLCHSGWVVYPARGCLPCTLLSHAAAAPPQLRSRAEDLLAAGAPGALGAGLPPLDPSRVYLGGHSYGGPSALLAAGLAASSSTASPDAAAGSTAAAPRRPAGLLLHDPAVGLSSNIDEALRGSGAGGGALGGGGGIGAGGAT